MVAPDDVKISTKTNHAVQKLRPPLDEEERVSQLYHSIFRMFDPRVDILSAEWHPLKETRWLFPLLTSLSDWREKLRLISKELSKTSNDTDIVFVADFPGTLSFFICID